MKYGRHLRMILLPGVIGASISLHLLGCRSIDTSPSTFRGLERAERYIRRAATETTPHLSHSVPLTIAGEAVPWEAILPILGEAAGKVAVEEVALEGLLHQEISRKGMVLRQKDLDQELLFLAASISGNTTTFAARSDATKGAARHSPLDTADTDRLIWQIRQRRGLGPVRFEGLLRRNAMLRMLVRDRVVVRSDQVELAWRVQHGERVQIRVLVVPTQRQAQQLRDMALAADAASLEMQFADLAQLHSTDNSAPLGGLIEPFSLEDPAYEQAIRDSIARLEPGQISQIVAVRNGYAVVYFQQHLQGDGVSLERARDALTEQLRRRKERLLMDALATQLLAEARIDIIDPSLSWSVDVGNDR